MVSRENAVIVGCIAAAVLGLFVASRFDPPAWVGGAILLGVGVVVPLTINEFLDRRAA